MITSRNIFLALSGGFALVCAVTACGGGGGSASGGSGGGGTPPIPPVVPLSASGTLQIQGAALGNGFVVYSCGCSAQAGSVTADGAGHFIMPAAAAATPSVPQPTYTLGPDRNYVVIASRTSAPGASTEAWTMEFVAQHLANNLALNASNTSDVYTTAGALYVFYFTQPNGSGELAFDQWNFNQVAFWVNNLKTTPTVAESRLIADINASQVANRSLFPTAPTWNRTQTNTNPQIAADLTLVKNQVPADTALPTPCPGTGCTGAPTP